MVGTSIQNHTNKVVDALLANRYHPLMLIGSFTFRQIWDALPLSSYIRAGLYTFIDFLERRLGARFLYNVEKVPYGDPLLAPMLIVAEKLRASGILKGLEQAYFRADVPRMFGWSVQFSGNSNESIATGFSLESNSLALTRALGEAQERYLWFEASDVIARPVVCTDDEIVKRGPALVPRRFAGHAKSATHGRSQDSFQYVRGNSLIAHKTTWVPAQLVSASLAAQSRVRTKQEPRIRHNTSTGMAAHPDQTQARLSGLLEVIERDAYMIMWLNQISCRRIEVSTITSLSEHVSTLLAACARYRLQIHIIQMPTDAPTHALCAVVEDKTSGFSKYSLGMKAGAHVSSVIEGALIEALRAHRNALSHTGMTPKRSDVTHLNRQQYWADTAHAHKLRFLVSGNIVAYTEPQWESESLTAHLSRLLTWCAESKYECISFPFTRSRLNVSPWHVELIIVPELQPLYFSESLPQIEGARLKTIPSLLGYSAREHPFTEEPHPFA